MSSRAPEDICGSVVYEFAVRQAGKKVPEKLKRFGKKRSELGACRELESTRSTETEEDGKWHLRCRVSFCQTSGFAGGEVGAVVK